jgi:hypothetical protein
MIYLAYKRVNQNGLARGLNLDMQWLDQWFSTWGMGNAGGKRD